MNESNDTKNGNGNGRRIVAAFDYLAGNTKSRFEHRLTSKCIAFVGKNRRGKTARLDAVRLALTGKHPVGPHGTDLFELAPENALSLSAALRGPGDLKSEFRVEVEGGKPRKPPEKPDRGGSLKAIEAMPGSDKLFENMMPTLSMRDLIRGSTLTREAVFRRWGDITSLPTPRGLTEEQLELWRKGRDEVKASKPKADVAEVLSGMSAYFRKVKLEKGREIKALEKLLKERDEKLAPAAAGAEDLPRLKEQLQAAEAWERTATLRVRKAEIEAEAAAYRERVQPYVEADKLRAQKDSELAEQRRAKQGAIDTLVSSLEELAKTRAAKVTEFDEQVKKQVFYLTGGEWLMECIHTLEGKADESGHAACVLCGNRCHVETLKKQVAPRVQARRLAVEKLYKERDQALATLDEEQRALETSRRKAEAELRAWESGVEEERRQEENAKTQLRMEYNRIRSARDENELALKDVPDLYTGPASAVVRATIKALEDAETASKQLDAEMKKLRELAIEQQLYQLLEQEAARELNTLLARTAETANAAVNRYMPEGFRAVLSVEEAQWHVVGMDGRAHGRKVMSGSEFGALVPALACAWTEGAPARYVLLDDEDLAPFDPENLALLLSSLKDAIEDGLLTQVFLAWSRAHEIPDDWGQKIYVDSPAPALAEPPASTAIVPSDTGPALLL